jgi:hypothetical protein
MHDLEVVLIEGAARDDDRRLILDGGIKSGKFTGKPHVVAVAKSFRKDVIFTFGSRKANNPARNDITRLLMGLRHFHRARRMRAMGGLSPHSLTQTPADGGRTSAAPASADR